MKALTNLEVNELVYHWYKKLDVHAPVEEVIPLLSADNLEMRFPEATLKSIGEFKDWYKRVTHLFFDEIHDMKMLNIELEGDMARVKLVVNWQARIWNPPAAKTKWLGFDAIQTWTVKRDSGSGNAVIATYAVDALVPMEGSASL
jgi:hypothetical protein